MAAYSFAYIEILQNTLHTLIHGLLMVWNAKSRSRMCEITTTNVFWDHMKCTLESLLSSAITFCTMMYKYKMIFLKGSALSGVHVPACNNWLQWRANANLEYADWPVLSNFERKQSQWPCSRYLSNWKQVHKYAFIKCILWLQFNFIYSVILFSLEAFFIRSKILKY